MIRLATLCLLLCIGGFQAMAQDDDARYIRAWASEWPNTDFSKKSIEFSEILHGGPPKDGIPPIDEPVFRPVSEMADMDPRDPVIGVIINGQAKAYPLSVLMWHEIANDTIGGLPVAVTYCPLCNTAIVFERRVGGEVTTFGVSGKLRNSDMVMYRLQTFTWCEQAVGQGILGN